MTPSLFAPILLLAVPAVAYLVFVFTAEHANPFQPPAAPLRRHRWRLGRDLGIVAFAVLAIGVWMPMVTPVTRIGGLVLATSVGALAWTAVVLVHRRRGRYRLWEASDARPGTMPSPDAPRTRRLRSVDIEI